MPLTVGAGIRIEGPREFPPGDRCRRSAACRFCGVSIRSPVSPLKIAASEIDFRNRQLHTDDPQSVKGAGRAIVFHL